MKRKKRNDKAAPELVPGPATNRRKANKPLAPAGRRKFLERGPAAACPDDDDQPADDIPEFFNARMHVMDDE